MGVSTSSIPEKIDLETFEEVVKGLQFLPDCELDARLLFDKLSDDDGIYSKSELMKLRNASDIYLAHDWGYDTEGRSTHDRVKYFSSECRKRGLITWLDEEREAQTMASMQSPTQLMMDGICGTQVVLVFITKRYIELVSECFQQSDLDCTTGPVIRDNQTTISPGQRTSSVAETKAGETTTFADMVDEDSALGVRWSNIDEDYDCPNPTKKRITICLALQVRESHRLRCYLA